MQCSLKARTIAAVSVDGAPRAGALARTACVASVVGRRLHIAHVACNGRCRGHLRYTSYIMSYMCYALLPESNAHNYFFI